MLSSTKRNILLACLLLVITGCNTNPQPVSTPTKAALVPESSPTPTPSVWSIYDADPEHPWNRVFRQLYRRVAADGREYGWDELDPLLWFDTDYLLEGDSHRQVLNVLDEFLSSHAENRVTDPLKRAMFQRDLWAVFDWSASQTEPHPAERRALQIRLAQIIRRVALSKEQIDSLPDNYALEIHSQTFLAVAPPNDLDAAFLPPDLLQADSAWVPMGREGGPIAMTHTEGFPFYGHSAFLVFVRNPEGRAATLEFIQSLNTERTPVTPVGTEVALLRRMLLIDDEGNLILSPLVETIQIRHFNPEQHFHEFELDRSRLLRGVADSLVSKNDLFLLFMSHGDVFENPDISELRATIPAICKACHSEYPPIYNSGNTHSIISYSRDRFPLPDQTQPVLHPTTWEDEADLVITWKRSHVTGRTLESFWDR